MLSEPIIVLFVPKPEEMVRITLLKFLMESMDLKIVSLWSGQKE